MPIELSAEINFAVDLPTSREMQDEIVKSMRKAVNAVLTRAKANLSGRFLKTRTGHGLASLRTKIQSTQTEATGTIGTPLFYLRILHTGFPAQVLTTDKKGFTFFRGGHVIRVKSIHHPGVTARPWLQTALEESTDDILLAFNEAAQGIGRFIAE